MEEMKVKTIEEPDLREVAGGDTQQELIDFLERVMRDSQQSMYREPSPIPF